MPSVARIEIQQAFNALSAQDVGGDDLLHVNGTDGGVEGIVGHDLDNRALLAETEATGHDHVHLVGDAVFLNRCVEVFYDFRTFGSLATRTATAEYLDVRGSGLKPAGSDGTGAFVGLPDGQRFGRFPSDAFESIGRVDFHYCWISNDDF